MADGIRLPFVVDLQGMEALTQELPNVAREAGKDGADALAAGWAQGASPEKAIDSLTRTINKNTKASLEGAAKIQHELDLEIRQIRKTAQGFENVAEVQDKVKQAVASATRAARRRVEALESSTDKLGKRFNVAAEMGSKLGAIPGLGRLGTALGGLAGGFSALLSPVGLAVAAVASVGAAFVGAAASGAILLKGLFDVVHGYEDLVDAVKPLESMDLGLTDEQKDSFGKAKAGVDSLGVVLKGLALTWASEFTPAIEEGTRLLVALGLAASDAFKVFTEANDPIKNSFKIIGEAMFRPLVLTNEFIQANITLADLLGIDVPAAVRIAASAHDKMTESMVNVPYQAAQTGWAGVTFAMGDYMDKADALIGRQRALNDAIGEGAQAAIEWVDIDLTPEIKAADEATAALSATWAQFAEDRSDASTQLTAEYQRQIDKVRELIDAGGDRVQGQELINMLTQELGIELAKLDPLYLSQQERLKALKDRQAEMNELQATAVKAAMEGLAAFNSLAQTTFQTRKAAYDEVKARHEDLGRALTETEKAHEAELKAAAKRAWKWQQGLAVAQALSQGAVAGVQALAQLGPIAGAIAAAGIVATTVASSVATIKSQQPEFARGGIVDPSMADSMGRVQATVEANEAVLNQRAAATLGSGFINNLNATGGAPVAPSGGSVTINFRDAPLDTMMYRMVQGPGQFSDMIRNITNPRGAALVMA